MLSLIQDDYLSKPVRGKTLEDMLLKWAVEGKRDSRFREAFRTTHIGNDSICTAPSSASISDPLNFSRSSEDDSEPAASSAPKIPEIETSKPRMQRLATEERAIILRDEKLLAASNPNPRQLSISMPPSPSSMRAELPTPALTFENMALLNRELAVNPFDLLNLGEAKDDDNSDSDESTNQGNSPEAKLFSFEPRRELERNSSSQLTVKLGKLMSYM